MKVLGICGQSGAGKTTALETLKLLGAVVCDSDRVSREIMTPETACGREVIAAFGDGIVSEGRIDRRALGEIVFASPKQLEILTEITHRYILAEIRERIEMARGRGESLFVIDAPLLFESGLDADCDLTLAVIADRELRIERITARDGITRELAEGRVDSQLSESELVRLADEVIVNNSTKDNLARATAAFAERRGLVK